MNTTRESLKFSSCGGFKIYLEGALAFRGRSEDIVLDGREVPDP